MPIRLKFALTAVALAAAASANATSFASASLGPIQIQLIDLNPTDGVTASITFGSGVSSSSYGYTYDGNGQSQSLPYIGGNYGVSTASTATTSTSVAFTGGTASSIQGATLSVTSQASGLANGGQGYYYGYLTAPNYTQFTLSANTAVVFSALGSTSASTTVGVDVTTGHSEYAYSSLYLTVSGSAPLSNSGSQSSSDSLSAYASAIGQQTFDPATNQYVYSYTGAQDSKNALLSASFMNMTSANKQGSIYAQAYNYGYSSIAAAVPEPETYAMLLAGLGVIGAVARRRRARSL